MKMKAFGMDANGRSTWSEVDVPFTQVSPLHAETAKQEGGYWEQGCCDKSSKLGLTRFLGL